MELVLYARQYFNYCGEINTQNAYSVLYAERLFKISRAHMMDEGLYIVNNKENSYINQRKFVLSHIFLSTRKKNRKIIQALRISYRMRAKDNVANESAVTLIGYQSEPSQQNSAEDVGRGGEESTRESKKSTKIS